MKYVGIKQVLKAVKEGSVEKVYIGEDAEEHVLTELLNTCNDNNITVIKVKTMAELGKMAGIDIGAAAAAE